MIVAVIALAGALSIAPVVSPPVALAAGTASVPTTQQLAAMRAEAAAVQARLSVGAKTLDAARRRLSQLQHKAAAAQAAAAKLDTKLAVLRSQIAQFAGDLYERPAADMMTTILSDDDIVRSLQGAELLKYANSSHTEVLREAAVDGQQAKVLKAQAQQDVAAGAAVQRSVTAQVAALQVEATKAADRLQAAEAAYEAEQARLAAEREAKAKAAREAAARADAARRARALADSQNASAGPCVSQGPYPAGPWGGYSDGLIPASQLCSIIGGGRLRPDAAAAFNRMSQAYHQQFGSYLCISDSYRSYASQVAIFRQRPSFAAVPGTSNHGWGLAVDLGCGVQNYGSAQYRWMTQHGGSFGWVHPPWAVHDPFEPWHWEFGNLGGAGGT